MQRIVLGYLSEQLSKFLIGFHEEQINLSLATGKGEIKDVKLNVELINELYISKLFPIFEIESIHVTKLGINVTSFKNIRKSPIILSIDDVIIIVREPLGYKHKYNSACKKGAHNHNDSYCENNDGVGSNTTSTRRGGYGLADRIGDNITLEINKIHLKFQPMGKFKTRRIGAWTPPCLSFDINNLKYTCVDEFGEEGTPDDIWRHNNNNANNERRGYRTIKIYKLLSFDCSAGLLLINNITSHHQIPLLQEGLISVQFCFHKLLRDASLLSLQIDASFMDIEIELLNNMNTIPNLIHFLTAFVHCIAKDRSFHDPLLLNDHEESTLAVVDDDVMVGSKKPIVDIHEKDHDKNNYNELSNNDEYGDEDNDDNDDDDDDDESFDEDDPFIKNINESSATKVGNTVQQQQQQNNENTPLISIRGFKIWEKVIFSLSIHDFCLRAFYGSHDNDNDSGNGSDGSLQIKLKGLVIDAMSSRDMKSNNGIIQLSLPYISIQEKYKSTFRPMLLGGIHLNDSVNSNAHSDPMKTIFEEMIDRDENFPLFESVSIRNDFTSSRNFLPIQSIGYKATIKLKDEVNNSVKQKDSMEDNTNMILNELGIDKILLILDTESWCRACRFFLNEDNGGFDPRWYTGKWDSEITPDMLVLPLTCRNNNKKESLLFNINNYLQPLPKPQKPGNAFMSTNARFTNISLRIPAIVKADVWSSNINVSLDEMMIHISPALPKTFLVGKIGGQKAEERKSNNTTTTVSFSDIVDFPNDPSDLCYYTSQDVNNKTSLISGTNSNNNSNYNNNSSVRIQISISSFSIKLEPILPIWQASEPKQLIAPTKITLLLCIESDVPYLESKELITQLYFSLLIHKLEINLDIELMGSIIRSILHHYNVFESTYPKRVSTNYNTNVEKQPTPKKLNKSKSYPSMKSKKSNILKRQISILSRRGSWMFIFCMHMSETDIRVWIQSNLVLKRDNNDNVSSPLLIPFIRFQLQELELGFESFYHAPLTTCSSNDDNSTIEASSVPDSNQMILKFCCKQLEFKTINLDLYNTTPITDDSIENQSSKKEYNVDEIPMLTLVTLGKLQNAYNEGKEGSEDDDIDSNSGIALRYHQTNKSILLSIEINGALLHCPSMKGIEKSLYLLVDTLFLPSGCTFVSSSDSVEDDVHSKNNWARLSKGETIFPVQSLGGLFESISQKFSLVKSSTDSKVADHSGITPKKDIDLFLISSAIKDAHVTIYDDKTKANVGVLLSDLKAFFCDLKTIPLLDCSSRILFTQLARCDQNWLERFDENEKGLHLLLDSIQRIITTDNDVEGPDISVHCCMKPSRMDTSMDNIGYLINCSSKIEMLKDVLHATVEDLVRVRNQMYRKLNLPKNSQSCYPKKLYDEGYLSQLQTKCEEISESSSSASKLLAKLKSTLFSNRDVFHNSVIAKKDKELYDLRIQSFQKERQRAAAVALLNTRKCGWVRFGAMRLSGQRLVKSATCHQLWLVLTENNVVVVYKEPGQAKPLDFIILDGAHLLSLSWGNRSSSNKRGFAIIDSNGRESVLLFRNGRDFDDWFKEIGRLVDFLMPNETNDETILGRSVDKTDPYILAVSNPQSSAMSANFRDKMASMSSQVKSSMSSVSSLKEKSASLNNTKINSKGDDSMTELSENKIESTSNDSDPTARTKEDGETHSNTDCSQVKKSMVGVVDLSSSKESLTTCNDNPVVANEVTSSVDNIQDVSTDADSREAATMNNHENADIVSSLSMSVNAQSSQVATAKIDSSNAHPHATVHNKLLSAKANMMKRNLPSMKIESFAAHTPTISTSFRDKMSFKSSSKYFKMNKPDLNASKRVSANEDGGSFSKGMPSVAVKTSSDAAKISDEEATNLKSSETDLNEDSTSVETENTLHDVHKNIVAQINEKLSDISLTDEKNVAEKPSNETTSLGETQSSNQAPNDYLNVWDSAPSNNNVSIISPVGRNSVLDKMNSFKTSAKQSMNVAVKSVMPDTNALKIINDGSLQNTVNLSSSDGHLQQSTIVEKMSSMKVSAKQSMQGAMKSMTPDANTLKLASNDNLENTTKSSLTDGNDHSHNILEKMTSMKTSAKQSMQVAAKSIALDTNALKLLSSGALHSTSQVSTSENNGNVVPSSSLTKLHIFSLDQEKQPIKLSNINTGADDILPCSASKLNQRDIEMTTDLMKWSVRITPFNSKCDTDAPGAHDLDVTISTSVDDEVKDPASCESTTSVSKDIESQFLVTIFNYDMKLEDESQKHHPVKAVVKNVSNFLALHSDLSNSISGIPIEAFSNQSRNKDTSSSPMDTSLGISLKEQIVIVGNLLALNCSSNEKNAAMSHQCNFLKQFLNLFLSSPIPKVVCETLLDFLAVKHLLDHQKAVHESSEKLKYVSENETMIQFNMDDVFNTANALESELIRSDQRNKVLFRDVTMVSSNFKKKISDAEPIKECTVDSNSIFYSMQNSLMKAMSERDEAHSQLIGASVLHSYLMQQERKKVERFTAKLDCLQNILATNNNNPSTSTRKKDNDMMQDNETELLSLCRQLSSEISGRTSTSLELARLQESYKLEREQEAAEKSKLTEKIKSYEELLLKEKAKCKEAKKEASHWRQLYEKSNNK